jgi:RNA polymerase sigma-70 factor (ECF subfamily)
LEHELIERAQNGDHTAYQSVVDAHREGVFRLAYLLLGDTNDAEDITQEVFIRAYHNLHRFDLAHPLRPWLLQITANCVRNRKRSIGRYWGMIQRFARHDLHPKHADTEALTVEQMDAQALLEAVQQLKIHEQEVIYLRFFLELSVDETATILDLPAGTVKSRLHRALKQLRFVVERDYPNLRPAYGE